MNHKKSCCRPSFSLAPIPTQAVPNLLLLLLPLESLNLFVHAKRLSILEPFRQVSQSSDARTLPHVIVIDALDECVQWAEQKAIIDILSSKFNAPQWKILVCSRPEPNLSRLLFDLESKSMLICAPLGGQYRSAHATVNDFHGNINLKGELDSIFKMAGSNEVGQVL